MDKPLIKRISPRLLSGLLILALGFPPSFAHARLELNRPTLRPTIQDRVEAGLEEALGGAQEPFVVPVQVSATADTAELLALAVEIYPRFQTLAVSALFRPDSALRLESVKGRYQERSVVTAIRIQDKNQPANDLPDEIHLTAAINNALDALADRAETLEASYEGRLTGRSGRTEQGEWFVELSDDGIGIPEQVLLKLFDKRQSTKPSIRTGKRLGGAGRAVWEGYYGENLIRRYRGRIEVDTRRPDEARSRLLTYDLATTPKTEISAGNRTEAGTTIRWIFGIDPVKWANPSAAGLEAGSPESFSSSADQGRVAPSEARKSEAVGPSDSHAGGRPEAPQSGAEGALAGLEERRAAKELLVGNVERAVDEKRRIALPTQWPSYRSAAAIAGELAEEGSWRFIKLSLAAADQPEAIPLNSQHRILLPEDWLTWVGLEKGRPVILLGVKDHLELWNPVQWEQFQADADADAAYTQTLEREMARGPWNSTGLEESARRVGEFTQKLRGELKEFFPGIQHRSALLRRGIHGSSVPNGLNQALSTLDWAEALLAVKETFESGLDFLRQSERQLRDYLRGDLKQQLVRNEKERDRRAELEKRVRVLTEELGRLIQELPPEDVPRLYTPEESAPAAGLEETEKRVEDLSGKLDLFLAQAKIQLPNGWQLPDWLDLKDDGKSPPLVRRLQDLIFALLDTPPAPDRADGIRAILKRVDEEVLDPILKTSRADWKWESNLYYYNSHDYVRALPRAEDWLLFVVSQVYPPKDEAARYRAHQAALASTSPRASALAFGRNGPHLRHTDDLDLDKLDVQTAPTLLGGFVSHLKELLKQVENLRATEEFADQTEQSAREYAGALWNGMMAPVGGNLRGYQRELFKPLAQRAKQRGVSLSWLLGKSAQLFPDLLPPDEAPDFLLFYNAGFAGAEIFDLASHNAFQEAMNRPPVSLWDFTVGNRSALSYRKSFGKFFQEKGIQNANPFLRKLYSFLRQRGSGEITAGLEESGLQKELTQLAEELKLAVDSAAAVVRPYDDKFRARQYVPVAIDRVETARIALWGQRRMLEEGQLGGEDERSEELRIRAWQDINTAWRAIAALKPEQRRVLSNEVFESHIYPILTGANPTLARTNAAGLEEFGPWWGTYRAGKIYLELREELRDSMKSLGFKDTGEATTLFMPEYRTLWSPVLKDILFSERETHRVFRQLAEEWSRLNPEEVHRYLEDFSHQYDIRPSDALPATVESMRRALTLRGEVLLALSAAGDPQFARAFVLLADERGTPWISSVERTFRDFTGRHGKLIQWDLKNRFPGSDGFVMFHGRTRRDLTPGWNSVEQTVFVSWDVEQASVYSGGQEGQVDLVKVPFNRVIHASWIDPASHEDLAISEGPMEVLASWDPSALEKMDLPRGNPPVPSGILTYQGETLPEWIRRVVPKGTESSTASRQAVMTASEKAAKLQSELDAGRTIELGRVVETLSGYYRENLFPVGGEQFVRLLEAGQRQLSTNPRFFWEQVFSAMTDSEDQADDRSIETLFREKTEEIERFQPNDPLTGLEEQVRVGGLKILPGGIELEGLTVKATGQVATGLEEVLEPGQPAIAVPVRDQRKVPQIFHGPAIRELQASVYRTGIRVHNLADPATAHRVLPEAGEGDLILLALTEDPAEWVPSSIRSPVVVAPAPVLAGLEERQFAALAAAARAHGGILRINDLTQTGLEEKVLILRTAA